MQNNGLLHSTGMGHLTETSFKPLYWNKTRTKIEPYPEIGVMSLELACRSAVSGGSGVWILLASNLLGVP